VSHFSPTFQSKHLCVTSSWEFLPVFLMEGSTFQIPQGASVPINLPMGYSRERQSSKRISSSVKVILHLIRLVGHLSCGRQNFVINFLLMVSTVLLIRYPDFFMHWYHSVFCFLSPKT
jgi:hypothetical protein